jgi:hypothetical protein
MNPIQPMTSLREINVVEPISPALEQVKRVLFRPFDLGKWFVIGFCAWLARLGEGGGFNFHVPAGGNNHGCAEFHHDFEQAKNYVLSNLEWIIPLTAFLVVICLGLGLLILWLNSRGKFMFLHCGARQGGGLKTVEPVRARGKQPVPVPAGAGVDRVGAYPATGGTDCHDDFQDGAARRA